MDACFAAEPSKATLKSLSHPTTGASVGCSKEQLMSCAALLTRSMNDEGGNCHPGDRYFEAPRVFWRLWRGSATTRATTLRSRGTGDCSN